MRPVLARCSTRQGRRPESARGRGGAATVRRRQTRELDRQRGGLLCRARRTVSYRFAWRPPLRLGAAAAPLLAAIALAYYHSLPRVRLVRLCDRPWSPSVALHAKRLLERSRLEPRECESRITARAAENLRRCLAFMADLHALRAELERQRRAVDPSDAAHAALLHRLWLALLPARGAWLRLGFQGADPCTDFRGMGGLALRELVHFAEVFREEALLRCEAWSRDHGAVQALPYALTAINASAWLWALFVDGKLDRCLCVRGEPPDVPQPLLRDALWVLTPVGERGTCWH